MLEVGQRIIFLKKTFLKSKKSYIYKGNISQKSSYMSRLWTLKVLGKFEMVEQNVCYDLRMLSLFIL